MFWLSAFALFRLLPSFPNMDNGILTIRGLNAEGGDGALDSN